MMIKMITSAATPIQTPLRDLFAATPPTSWPGLPSSGEGTPTGFRQ